MQWFINRYIYIHVVNKIQSQKYVRYGEKSKCIFKKAFWHSYNFIKSFNKKYFGHLMILHTYPSRNELNTKICKHFKWWYHVKEIWEKCMYFQGFNAFANFHSLTNSYAFFKNALHLFQVKTALNALWAIKIKLWI